MSMEEPESCYFNKGSRFSIFLIRIAVRGIASATVRPTTSFSAAISFITRITCSIFIPSGSVPTAAMISAGSNTSISKWITTFDAPQDFSHSRIASLLSATSSPVIFLIPYCCWRTLISSRSQFRIPTGLFLLATQK